MSTVYEQIKTIARPVVTGYWTDITEHDRRAIQGGSASVPRPGGRYL